MPRYGWSDEDLYKVTRYVMDRLTDPDLLKDVSKPAEAQTAELQSGSRLFQEKGCSSCHVISGIKTQQDFGPDLSAEGTKTVSQLDFGDSKIPRAQISFIEAKISNPVSVNSNARMPQYHFKEGDAAAIITAVLGMQGPQSVPGVGTLVVPDPTLNTTPPGILEKYTNVTNVTSVINLRAMAGYSRRTSLMKEAAPSAAGLWIFSKIPRRCGPLSFSACLSLM